jgi:hypothetical protein
MIAGICDPRKDEPPGNAGGACKILVGDQYGVPPSPVPLATVVVGVVDSVNAAVNHPAIRAGFLPVSQVASLPNYYEIPNKT